MAKMLLFFFHMCFLFTADVHNRLRVGRLEISAEAESKTLLVILTVIRVSLAVLFGSKVENYYSVKNKRF